MSVNDLSFVINPDSKIFNASAFLSPSDKVQICKAARIAPEIEFDTSAASELLTVAYNQGFKDGFRFHRKFIIECMNN